MHEYKVAFCSKLLFLLFEFTVHLVCWALCIVLYFSALEGSLKCLADTEEENDTWMWNIYESMKFEACKSK